MYYIIKSEDFNINNYNEDQNLYLVFNRGFM